MKSHQEVIYTNWAQNEPKGTTGQNCGWKTYSHHPGWHDAICSEVDDDVWNQRHALCQVDI